MNREYYQWYSYRLHRDMELLVFGHAGAKVLVFPTRCGRFYEYEEMGLVEIAIDGATLLRQRFPRGRLVRLPNAGHLLHLENTEEKALIYLNFLRTYSIGSFWKR